MRAGQGPTDAPADRSRSRLLQIRGKRQGLGVVENGIEHEDMTAPVRVKAGGRLAKQGQAVPKPVEQVGKIRRRRQSDGCPFCRCRRANYVL